MPASSFRFGDSAADVENLMVTMREYSLHFGYGSSDLVRDERNRLVPKTHVHAYVVRINGAARREGEATDIGPILLKIEGQSDVPQLKGGVAVGEIEAQPNRSLSGELRLPRTMVRDMAAALRVSRGATLVLYSLPPDRAGRRSVLGLSASLVPIGG